MTEDLLPSHRYRAAIATWLFAVLAMLFVMVVLGGVTRLTQSGLSMVEWHPVTGWLPPTSEAAWRETFQNYQQFPEFRQLNFTMDLTEFKKIFWLEYLHRLWGRLIGVAFFVPLIYFVARHRVDWRLGVKLGTLFVLGGLQGGLGWYMVKSGLAERPDVSQYRLSAHLGAALVIYGYMLWVALGLLFPEPQAPPGGRKLWWSSLAVLALIFVTVLSGAFVAGTDAGFAYNTFPLMAGQWVPDGLFDMDPFILNFLENITTIQFEHRLLAETLFVVIAAFWIKARRAALTARARRAFNGLVALAAVQIALGITTLILVVPVALASAHQAGALVLYTFAVWMSHELRPRPA